MRIIISPAKNMRTDTDSFACHGLPQFLPKTEQILTRLRAMSYEELKALWKCNEQIADLNYQRIQNMDLHRCLTPAILSFSGIQYQYMAPNVFSQDELDYTEKHLRILSGFYGVLRPFDGVVPYRLEMQARLSICKDKNLYSFWGADISEKIFSETDCVVDLASKEYSVCVSRYIPEGIRMIRCIFGERKAGKIMEKGTQCKMARGEMVRYMAEQQVKTPEDMQNFDRLGYCFFQEGSTADIYVFIKEKAEHMYIEQSAPLQPL